MHDLLNASLTHKSQINIITIGSISVKMSKFLGASLSEHIMITYITKIRFSMELKHAKTVHRLVYQAIQIRISEEYTFIKLGTCCKTLLVLKGRILKTIGNI